MTSAARKSDAAPSTASNEARDIATLSVTSLALPASDLEPSTMVTLDGRYVTGGLAEIVRDGACWTATLKHLDRPGLVATMYFGEGLRNIVLRLHDGRAAKARITGTSFLAGSQRICRLTGIEPLA